MSDKVRSRFEEINWCNLSLLTMKVERFDDREDFVIEVSDIYKGDGQTLEIRFIDTTYLSLTIDFASKRSCGDAFDGSRCLTESPWRKSVVEANPYDNFDSYLHFELGLVPKGGLINLLALDFELREL